MNNMEKELKIIIDYCILTASIEVADEFINAINARKTFIKEKLEGDNTYIECEKAQYKGQIDILEEMISILKSLKEDFKNIAK